MPEKYRRAEVVRLTSTTLREAETEVSPCGPLREDMLWSSLPGQHPTTSSTSTNNNNNNNNNNNTTSSSSSKTSSSSSSKSSSSNSNKTSSNSNNTNSINSTSSTSNNTNSTTSTSGSRDSTSSVRRRSRGGATGESRAGHISQIAEGLFLCGARAVRPARVAELGVTCVVNATTELPNAPLQGVRVVAVRVPDEPSADLASHLASAADTIHEELSRGGRVLVHCVAGVSRSPVLVLAYLVRHGGMTLRDAFLHVRAARPSARPNSGFFSQLIDFEQQELGRGSVELCHTPGGRVPDVLLEEVAAMQDKRCLGALGDRRALQRVYA